MKLTFLGAAGTVTGSRTLVESRNKYLIDCGLFQGPKTLRQRNWNAFPLVSALKGILLTHAHLDHTGFMPRLVKYGYNAPIYCTPETAALTQILLLDSAHLQEEDANYANRTGHSKHNPAQPLYDTADAKRTNQLLVPVERDQWHQLEEGLAFQFLRSGHILGSSLVHMSYTSGNGSCLVTFSGDLGNGRSCILKPPVQLHHTDFLIMESTYGDRLQPRIEPQEDLARIVNRVNQRSGVLLIPAFSVGRTQEILFLLRELEERELIESAPVFLDSPMANEATRVFLKFPEDHRLKLSGTNLESPISTKHYIRVETQSESQALTQKEGPMIIISASGMLSGGRVMHHLKSRVSDPNNAILLVGHQAEETKGRLLQDGLKRLRIHHKEYEVNAEIITFDHLSAHADQRDILEWVGHMEKKPERIFLNHGEGHPQMALKQKIEMAFEIPVTIPGMGESFDLRKKSIG